MKIVWHDNDDIHEYRTYAGSSTAAIRKTLIALKKEIGHELRLGQGTVHIVIERTHKREIERWVENGNKIVH